MATSNGNEVIRDINKTTASKDDELTSEDVQRLFHILNRCGQFLALVNRVMQRFSSFCS